MNGEKPKTTASTAGKKDCHQTCHLSEDLNKSTSNEHSAKWKLSGVWQHLAAASDRPALCNSRRPPPGLVSRTHPATKCTANHSLSCNRHLHNHHYHTISMQSAWPVASPTSVCTEINIAIIIKTCKLHQDFIFPSQSSDIIIKPAHACQRLTNLIITS